MMMSRSEVRLGDLSPGEDDPPRIEAEVVTVLKMVVHHGAEKIVGFSRPHTCRDKSGG